MLKLSQVPDVSCRRGVLLYLQAICANCQTCLAESAQQLSQALAHLQTAIRDAAEQEQQSSTELPRMRALLNRVILIHYQQRGLADLQKSDYLFAKWFAMRIILDEEDPTPYLDDGGESYLLQFLEPVPASGEWTCLEGARKTCLSLLGTLPVAFNSKCAALPQSMGSPPSQQTTTFWLRGVNSSLRQVASNLAASSPDFDQAIELTNKACVDLIVLTYELGLLADCWAQVGDLVNLEEVLLLAKQDPAGLRPY